VPPTFPATCHARWNGKRRSPPILDALQPRRQGRRKQICSLMERRELADGPIDQVGLGGIVERIAVDLHRAKQRLGRVGVGRQERLAADDHDLATPRNTAAGAKDVLKLCAVHGRPAGRSPSAPGATGSHRTGCSDGGAVPPPPDPAREGGWPPTPAPGCGPIPPPPATESPETTAGMWPGPDRGGIPIDGLGDGPRQREAPSIYLFMVLHGIESSTRGSGDQYPSSERKNPGEHRRLPVGGFRPLRPAPRRFLTPKPARAVGIGARRRRSP